jgi:antitoxin HicB
MSKIADYPFEIRPLAASDGGGYLISYPDFNDCVSDGETVEEAIANGRLALKETIAALKQAGHPVPNATKATTVSGKFVARVPKSVHAKLSSQAKAEGVSLNTLVVSLLSEGLGKKSAHV